MNILHSSPLAWHLAIVSSLVLAAGFAIHFLLRRRPAALRELGWRSVFMLLLLLPLTWWLRPLGMLTPEAPIPLSSIAMPLPLPEAPSASAPASSNPAPPPLSTPNWPITAGLLWLAGSLILLLRMAAGLIRQRRWKAGAAPCQDATALEIWHGVDPAGKGSLFISPDCPVPLTWGKTVLIPHASLSWHPKDLQAALRHEMSHLERGDWRYRILGEIAVAFFWPHPLLWPARRLWHRSQEESCDDAVLRAGTEPENYAALLCAAARSWTRRSAPAMAMAQPSSLEHRLRAVLEADRPRAACSGLMTKAAGMGVLLAFGASALAQTGEASREPASAASIIDESEEHTLWKSPDDISNAPRNLHGEPESMIGDEDPKPVFERVFPGAAPALRNIGSTRTTDAFLENSEPSATAPANLDDLKITTRKLRNLHNSLKQLDDDELITAFLKIDNGNRVIRRLGWHYEKDQIELQRLLKSGYGPKHPKLFELTKSTEETRKILLAAGKNYRESLAVTVRNLEDALTKLEAKAK